MKPKRGHLYKVDGEDLLFDHLKKVNPFDEGETNFFVTPKGEVRRFADSIPFVKVGGLVRGCWYLLPDHGKCQFVNRVGRTARFVGPSGKIVTHTQKGDQYEPYKEIQKHDGD